jgi:uncharacterized protein (DUF983 family)
MTIAGGPEQRQPLGRLLARALRRRCPRCGEKVFEGWFKMHERCPRCAHLYERESGYWVMAIVINTAVMEALFAILFLTVIVASMPDVDWRSLLVALVITNGIFPVFFYPFSKTIWVAIDLYLHPSDPT